MNFIPDNTRQGTFSIIIVILLLFCIRVGFSINEPMGYFSENLLPEITGMLIELVLILFLFEQWKKKNKQDILITKEKRLREYLIFFLRHSFKSLPRDLRVGRFYGEEHPDNIEYLDKLLNHVKENGLSTEVLDAMREQCEIDLTTYGNLLPVAADLTDEHFKAWSRILYYMIKISKRNGDDEDSISYILSNIKRYENASHESGIYVGSNALIKQE